MKILKRNLLVIATTLFVAAPVNAEILVSDSFESGDMSAPGFDGFSWNKNNRTSVVSSTGVLWNNQSIDVAIPSGRDWSAYQGENSLRFRYPKGSNMAEQRFTLDAGHPELWISFWLRVPMNFTHPSGHNNQKLFSLWMDGYEHFGEGATVTFQYSGSSLPEAGEGGSITRLYHVASADDTTGRHSGESGGSEVFISVPADRGRWMQIIIRASAATGAGGDDGVIEMWRMWEGEEVYSKLHEQHNAKMSIPPESSGFRFGYLLGWANSAYPVDTEFLVDNFIISTSSLLGAKPQPPLNPTFVAE